MPKISVVIPAYNAMSFLPETLASVLNQTYQDFEVIIVNDGSSDSIEQWFATLNHPKVKLISQENRGLSGARNTGILSAQGIYIALLDADDTWAPIKLERQVQVMDASPEAGLVYTWTALMNEQGALTGRYYQRSEEGDVWRSLLEFNLVGCGSVPLIRRSCLDSVGLFDENLRSFVEDWDLWLRMARNYPFKVVKEALVYYRQRSGSASKNWEAMERSYQIVVEKTFPDPVNPHSGNITTTNITTANSQPANEQPSLKNKCQGFIYLNLAWMALQGYVADYEISHQYQQKALRYYPGVLLKWEFWRLSSAIFLARNLGDDGYQNIRSMLSGLRSRFSLLKS